LVLDAQSTEQENGDRP